MKKLRRSFASGRRLALIILNERASQTYDIQMIQRIMEEEGGGFFDVRSIILGHIQRGGAPSPFDRVLAARLSAHAVMLLAQAESQTPSIQVVGLRGNRIVEKSLDDALDEMAWPIERPKSEWFMSCLALTRSF